MSKFYNGKYDIVFKTVLCNENKQYQLQYFLEQLLKIKIEEFKILNNELPSNYVQERRKIVDLIVRADQRYIHVEVNQDCKDYIKFRNFCSFVSILSKKTKRGKRYNLSEEFIHVDISFHMRKKKGKEKREYHIKSEDGIKYIKNLKIVEFNMDRIIDYWYNKNTKKIEEWKYLIMLGLETKEELEELVKGDAFMEEYAKDVTELNEREEFTSWLTPEEDAQMILNTEKDISYKDGIKTGMKTGIKTGMKNGMIIGIQKTARNLLKSGVSPKIISSATGLSLKQLQQLQK